MVQDKKVSENTLPGNKLLSNVLQKKLSRALKSTCTKLVLYHKSNLRLSFKINCCSLALMKYKANIFYPPSLKDGNKTVCVSVQHQKRFHMIVLNNKRTAWKDVCIFLIAETTLHSTCQNSEKRTDPQCFVQCIQFLCFDVSTSLLY